MTTLSRETLYHAVRCLGIFFGSFCLAYGSWLLVSNPPVDYGMPRMEMIGWFYVYGLILTGLPILDVYLEYRSVRKDFTDAKP